MKCKNILQLQNAEIQLMKKSKHESIPLKYKTWFVKNAHHFEQVDRDLSKVLAKQTNAKIKQCYHNCWHIATIRRNYKYYEGFVWSKTFAIPLEHSWLVQNNKVIDPTLIIDNKTAKKQIKKYLKDQGDFPVNENRLGDEYMGVQIPIDFVTKLAFKRKATGAFLFDYFRKVNNIE